MEIDSNQHEEDCKEDSEDEVIKVKYKFIREKTIGMLLLPDSTLLD